MDELLYLIAIALCLGGLGLAAFLWALKSGQFDDLDGAAHRVFADDAPVAIGPTEYRLLHFFMTHPERVYSRAQLLDHVWGGSVYVEERTVDVHIRRLRKTLEPSGLDGMVQTVRGAGYRFSAST